MNGPVTIICFQKCSTCKKAEEWLKNNGMEYIYRPIKEERPTVNELRKWILQTGLPIQRFFNTSGLLYRENNMKDKISILSQDELIDILASDGMMVKRPILLIEDKVLIGFREKEWQEVIKETSNL